MYHQQRIDWNALLESVDQMFPPAKPVTNPEPRSAVFCEKWTDYRGDTADWLREMPKPVSDTQIVSFVRVTRTMAYQGARLHRSKPKSVPDGVDAHEWIQTFADRCGGGMEAYNSHQEVVAKFVPSDRLKPGRCFI